MQLYNGDCIEIMKGMPSESIDSVVTDPPAGIAFMGKEWDKDKGGRDGWIKWMAEVMTECLRLLKPGGHALVWALPRTSHWTATACENAGFEIRDVVHHLFGSGFPKSHDISKAIDKAAGVEFSSRPAQGVGFMNNTDDGYNNTLNQLSREGDSTPEAQKWEGFGTALKPAAEHWILCRKPLIGTVAENVLTHGTGALNIDGCRVETAEKWDTVGDTVGDTETSTFTRELNNSGRSGSHDLGRFPANLTLTHSAECGESCAPDCPCGEIDKGIAPICAKERPREQGAGNNTFPHPKKTNTPGPPSTGLPSSYFKTFRYNPKISPDDRGEGNNHPTVKPMDLMRWLITLITPPKGIVLDCFMGSGSTGKAALQDGFDFVGIEQDPEYFKIAESRIHKAGAEPSLF